MRITTQARMPGIIERLKSKGKKVGLVSGCFDILHIGHIELFRFAKRHVDILVVALDNDESVSNSKYSIHQRPVHNEEIRIDQLAELRSIDYVFVIDGTMTFGKEDSYPVWENMLRMLKPDMLITHDLADSFAAAKKRLAKKLGIVFLGHEKPKHHSTTVIAKILLETA